MRKPVAFANFPASLRVPFGPYAAVTQQIVDGDTFDVLIDIGVNEYPYRTIRLRDVDAPEKNRAATKLAGLAAQAFLETLLPLGTPVRITTTKDQQSFGRYVAVVTLADGRDVGAEMVAAGHAVVNA